MKKAKHKILGEVHIDDLCEEMQRVNADPNTMFVIYDGELLEVTAKLVTLVAEI